MLLESRESLCFPMQSDLVGDVVAVDYANGGGALVDSIRNRRNVIR